MLAHELRNPLAPIQNAGEVLGRLSIDNTHARKAVAIVQRQVVNLARLVDDLLDISRITQGRVELQQRPVSIAEVVNQASEMVDPLLKLMNHEFSVTTHGTPCVLGDPTRLVQCVANVLGNAAKYTLPGGKIQLQVREGEGQVTIAVIDNGIGIPAELQAKVFDLFVQGDRTADRAQGGLGIGLSVVKRLIEMHGGAVTVFSAGKGRGSRFELRLPLLGTNEVDDIPKAPLKSSGRRILVVDDNADAADSLVALLAMDGHVVECAYAPLDAIEKASAFRPEIIFMDIGLPGTNGYELAGRLRRMTDLQAVRLVALTGYGLAEDKQRALDAGFESHLTKPAMPEAIQAVLARLDG